MYSTHSENSAIRLDGHLRQMGHTHSWVRVNSVWFVIRWLNRQSMACSDVSSVHHSSMAAGVGQVML